MAPRSKKHALEFTHDSSDTVGPRSGPLPAVASMATASVEVARVSFLQATRSWLCNQFDDVVHGHFRHRRKRPKAKENVRPEQEQPAAVIRSRRKTSKNDPQNQQARLSRSYGQLEFYSDTERASSPSSRSCIVEGTPKMSRSLSDSPGSSRIPLQQRNDVRNSPTVSKSGESRLTLPTHFKTSSCGDAGIVLVPDTPEAEYGMTIKMRQIQEFKRRLF